MRRRRLCCWGAAAAVILLLIAGLLLYRGTRTDPIAATAELALSPEGPMTDRENPIETAVETPASAEDAPLSTVTLKPARHLFDRPTSTAKRPSEREADLLVSRTPPPLPPPSSKVQQDTPITSDAPRGLHRLDRATEEELRRQAETVPEVGLGSSASAVALAYLNHVSSNQEVIGTLPLTDATPLLEVRPDLHTLPIRFGDRCRLQGKAAVNLDRLSRKLRVYLNQIAPVGPEGQRGSPEKLRKTLRAEMRGKRPEWLRAEAVPTLQQLLMAEDRLLRLLLVELLAEIKAPEAAAALAQRASFDLSPEVREAAVTALQDRSAAEYRLVLLRALRYPWAAPAQHAAEALVMLQDVGSVSTLVSLLKLPDPAGPLTIHKNRHVLQDVVRVNHVNNCMMCHPPATSGNEPVLGVDPVATLPSSLQNGPLATAAAQIRLSPGSHNYPGGPPRGLVATKACPLLIRGDITFLHQDFSVQQPVGAATPLQGANAVRRQRFDYVIRTRILPRKLYARLEEAMANRSSYPQRDAVLFALRALTGKDAGPTTEAWVQLFPNAETDVEAARLSRKLLKLDGVEREVLLAKCRDGKGIAYTQALACAIASLRGVSKEHARGVLMERLTRMSMKTLRDKLQDEDPEIRRAAVLACARKDKEQAVPELIALLDNPEPVTARLAEEGLARITSEHLKHPAAWKDWWRKHGEQGLAK